MFWFAAGQQLTAKASRKKIRQTNPPGLEALACQSISAGWICSLCSSLSLFWQRHKEIRATTRVNCWRRWAMQSCYCTEPYKGDNQEALSDISASHMVMQGTKSSCVLCFPHLQHEISSDTVWFYICKTSGMKLYLSIFFYQYEAVWNSRHMFQKSKLYQFI